MTTEELVEQAAKVLDAHRWKTMSVSSVECECGAVVSATPDTPTLTRFPADEAFRRHVAAELVNTLEETRTR